MLVALMLVECVNVLCIRSIIRYSPLSPSLQVLVCDGVSSLEKATRMVNQLSLFSGNEAVEELPTSDLR